MIRNDWWPRYVPREVWIVEGESTDPQYNFARVVFYVDKEMFQIHWKLVYNRAGEYWKLVITDFAQGWSPDGNNRYVVTAIQMAIDDKTDHAGIGTGTGTQGNLSEYNTYRLRPDNFSVDNLLRWGK